VLIVAMPFIDGGNLWWLAKDAPHQDPLLSADQMLLAPGLAIEASRDVQWVIEMPTRAVKRWILHSEHCSGVE